MQFEWDAQKNASNYSKHGVRFELAQRVFLDPFHLSAPDAYSPADEERWHTLGMVDGVVLLLVVYCYRASDDQEGSIRIISARKATQHERRIYETKPR